MPSRAPFILIQLCFQAQDRAALPFNSLGGEEGQPAAGRGLELSGRKAIFQAGQSITVNVHTVKLDSI